MASGYFVLRYIIMGTFRKTRPGRRGGSRRVSRRGGRRVSRRGVSRRVSRRGGRRVSRRGVSRGGWRSHFYYYPTRELPVGWTQEEWGEYKQWIVENNQGVIPDKVLRSDAIFWRRQHRQQ